ncbi:hypothetical protein J8J14_24140 [Roseomonas sp. SSH11]|uniref:Uncharacterized protein n=1 Tax=Pararoseomonas baculiformis TaxID=2820812 RepID=A0ABS4AMQ2_9PROT|nr:hypothetical protein [Pararoseomonas baculiformis]MBP0447835.1 hypothetical protein [Pararoseomonas baculiformis]
MGRRLQARMVDKGQRSIARFATIAFFLVPLAASLATTGTISDSSITISLVFAIAGLAWSNWVEFASIKNDMEEAVASFTNIQYLGPAQEAYSIIFDRASRAVAIRNTFIEFSGPMLSGDQRPVPVNSADRLKIYNQFFTNVGSFWADIFSANIVLDPARDFESFEASIKKITGSSGELDQGNDPVATVSNRPSLYSATVLKSPSPQINFTIFHFINGEKEVLFGWGIYPGDLSGSVFSSRDSRAVDYFEGYFRALLQHSEPVYGRHSIVSRTRELVGLWIDFAHDEEDGHLVERNVAAKEIYWSDGLLQLRGYTMNPNHTIAGFFRSRAIEIDEKELWYVYDAPDSRSKTGPSVGATYIRTFSRAGRKIYIGKYIDEENRSVSAIYGVLVDAGLCASGGVPVEHICGGNARPSTQDWERISSVERGLIIEKARQRIRDEFFGGET